MIFPSAVPEIPVQSLQDAVNYYVTKFGFTHDWGDAGGGIAGVSRGNCRLFLTDRSFREQHANTAPVVIWINLHSKPEVDHLFDEWRDAGAEISAMPEDKPWHLREFTAHDPDGNRIRVFYDFARDSS